MRRNLILALLLGCASLAQAGPSAASGPITVDSTTFVAGSSVMGTDGGVYSDTLPPVASTTTAAFRMTKYRAEHVNLRDSSGVEFGTTGNPLHTAGSTIVSVGTVTVNNSSFSVTGSTVSISGTVAVSIAGAPTVNVSNNPLTVSLSTTNVSGSTVSLSNSNLNVTVTNSPTVLISNVPAVRISSPIAAGTNNIGTVSGSTVSVSGSVTASISGTPNVYVVNPTTATVTGQVDVTGSSVTITNTGFAVTNTPAVTVSNTPNVYVTNVSTVTPKAGSIFNVTGSSVNAVVTGAVTATISGTPSVNASIVNVPTTTVSGLVNVTGSSVTMTGSVSILGTPSVSIANTPNVAVTSLPSVTVTNSSFSVTGSTVNVAGTLSAVFAGTAAVNVVNIATVSISGTPTVAAAQSGSWMNTVQVLNPVGTPTSVGYAAGSTQLPASISDGVTVASVTTVAGQNGLNVNIIGGAGAGGTASNFAASFPTAGTAAGFVNPSGLMQPARVDASSNALVSVTNSSFSVTGSTVSIAGSISISTSTPFNVTGSTISIGGTPTVFVGNTPSVNINNTPNVAVTNTVTTTVSNPLPAGSNVIGGVTISGTVPISISTVSVQIDGSSNTVKAVQSGAWSVSATPVGTSTVTFNGIAQPVTLSGASTVYLATTSVSINGSSNTVQAIQSGSWTDTVTQGTNSSLRASVAIDGSSNTVVLGAGTANVGKVVFQTPTTTAFSSATINTASTGDTVLVSTQSAQTVRVFRMFFVVSAATTISFRGGTENLTGAMTFTSGGAFILDFQGDPWFVTAASTGFILNQTGTAQISGRVYFTQS